MPDFKELSWKTNIYSGKVSYTPSVAYSGSLDYKFSHSLSYGISLSSSVALSFGLLGFAYKLGATLTLKGRPQAFKGPKLDKIDAILPDYTLGTNGNMTGSDSSLGSGSSQFFTKDFVIGNRATSGALVKTAFETQAAAAAYLSLGVTAANALFELWPDLPLPKTGAPINLDDTAAAEQAAEKKYDDEYNANKQKAKDAGQSESSAAKPSYDRQIDGIGSVVALGLATAPTLVAEALVGWCGYQYDKVHAPLLENAILLEPTFSVTKEGIAASAGAAGKVVLAAGAGLPGVPAQPEGPNGVPPAVPARPNAYGTAALTVGKLGINLSANAAPVLSRDPPAGITIDGIAHKITVDATGVKIANRAGVTVIEINPAGKVSISALGGVMITGDVNIQGNLSVWGSGEFMRKVHALNIQAGA
ncbi:hypothetical protein [Acidisoma sp. C75]